MYSYFLWNHKDPINGCPAQEVERQHNLEPKDAVYFLTRDGTPFLLLPKGASQADAAEQARQLEENQTKAATLQQVAQKVELLENVMDELLTGTMEEDQ